MLKLPLSPGGLHTGIERQQIGLEGNLIDDADDVVDLLGGFLDLIHGLDCLGHHLARSHGAAVGVVGDAASLFGDLESFRDLGGNGVQRRGGLFERRRLPFGAAGEFVGAVADFASA